MHIKYRKEVMKTENEVIVRKWALGVKIGRNNDQLWYSVLSQRYSAHEMFLTFVLSFTIFKK